MTPSSRMRAKTGRAARRFRQPAPLHACRMRALALRRLAIVRPAELIPRACRHETARLEQAPCLRQL